MENSPNKFIYTDPNSRTYIQGIPNTMTESQLKESLKNYGEVEIHTFSPGKVNDGWAFVGFTTREAAEDIVAASAQNSPVFASSKAPKDGLPSDLTMDLPPIASKAVEVSVETKVHE